MERSLLIFSNVTFKMAAWWPYWIFQFPDSWLQFGFEHQIQTSVGGGGGGGVAVWSAISAYVFVQELYMQIRYKWLMHHFSILAKFPYVISYQ